MAELVISHVIAHELIKEQYKSVEKSNIRQTALDKDNPTVQKLLEGVAKVYGTRMNAAHYGTFKTTHDKGPFPGQYRQYLDEHQDPDVFIDLTKTVMTELFRLAEAATASTGGYIFFADFTKASERYFLIVMIKKTPGIVVSANLEPEELERLDLDKLSQAARINVGKFLEYLEADDTAKAEINYLSFISPSAAKGAAGYFITALGCSKGSTSSQATKLVITETEKFFRERADWNVNSGKLRRDITDYLREKKESEESARLSDIEEIVRKNIPTEHADSAEDIVEELIRHLNSEDIGVPVEFPVHASTLKKNTHLKGKSSDWNLEFDRDALGRTDAATVYYDNKNKTLTLKNIPDDFLSQIEDQLAQGR